MNIDDIHVGAAVYRPLTEFSSSTTTNKAVVVGDFPCEQGAMKNEGGMASSILFTYESCRGSFRQQGTSTMTVRHDSELNERRAAFRREPEQLL